MKILGLVSKFWQKRYFNILAFTFAFLPIIFVGNTNELFEFPKTFFVYFIAIILIVLVTYDFLFSSIKLPMLPLPILFYLAAFVVSVIFSTHLYTSVWGYYSRFNDGLTSVLSFLVIYIVLRIYLSRDEFEMLTKILILTIIPISIFGIIQHFGIFRNTLWIGSKVGRVYSTMGQPNWLAQYLSMLLPISLYYFAREEKKLYWGFVFLMGYSCLWLTYSLSGYLGFMVALIAMLFLLLKTKPVKQTLINITILLSLCILTSVLTPGLFRGRFYDMLIDFKRTFSYIGVLSAQEEYKISDPGYIRTGLWRGSWNLITSSPKIFLIGVGPETFPYEFQKFRPKSLNFSSEWNYVFNKPHNYYIELWSESGLAGIISFALLIGYLLIKSNQSKLPSIAAFIVTNMFGWPVVASTLLMWFWLAELEVKGDAE